MQQAIDAYVTAGSKCPKPGGQHRANLADVIGKLCKRVKLGPKGGETSLATVWKYDAQHEELERIKDANSKEFIKQQDLKRKQSIWDDV